MTLSCRMLQVDVWLVDEKNNESMLVSDAMISFQKYVRASLIDVFYFQGGCQIGLEDFNINSPVTFGWFNLLSSTVSFLSSF